MKTKLLALLSVLIITAFVLSACQPQTVEVIKTVEVEKEVVTTQEVEVVVTEVVEVEREAFTTPHPILSDLRVRQALAYCTNKVDLVKASYPLLSAEEQEELVMHTMMPRVQWAYAGDENITIYPYDPEKGKALLEEAGWTMDEGVGFRVNEAGDALSLKFTTTSAAFRQTWAAVLEQQYADCGVQIIRLHAPASWWFGDTTGLARRDFELGAYAWVGQADPGGQTLYACDQIPTPANGWEGQNYPGWCNEAASAAIKNANNTLTREERLKWYTILQQEYTKDLPTIPLFNRAEAFASAPDMVGFEPTPGEEYYNWNSGEWEIPGRDTFVLGLTQEPASLFNQVEDAWVTHIVLFSLGAERPYTSLNFDFQPLWTTDLPTIESGLASNNDVEVSEGTMVIDANGEVVELAAGVTVRDKDGNEVEFSGGTVMMKQLVMNYEWRDDLKWPDGTPLSQADLELGYKTRCDKESGATTFIGCDRTQSVEFDGLVVTHTKLPGDQDPLYYVDMTNWLHPYPAHRVLSDGRVLADVPASEWSTLAEIAEMPWGFGPYMVKEWVKGEKIVLEAHPYWFGGTPKTPNFIFAIVTPENAEAQLLGGQVDLLGSETLAGITEALANAEAEGKIKTYSISGATWEHIDLNMFLK